MSDQNRAGLANLLTPRGNYIHTGSTLLTDYAFQYPVAGNYRRAATPFKYALALAYLTTPEQMNDLIKRKAERRSNEEGRNVSFKETKDAFYKGFKRQAGGNHVLQLSPGQLMDIARKGTSYDARIIAKSSGKPHKITLSRMNTEEGDFGYTVTGSCCDERYVNEGMRQTQLDCGHVTTLMVLAELGHILEGKQATNLTGLLPSQRLAKAALPFSYFEPGQKKQKQDLLFDMLWDWSVPQKHGGRTRTLTQREINMQALDNPLTYSEAGRRAFEAAGARYIAIGEAEQFKAEDVTPAKAELYAAMRRFKQGTINHLRQHGFKYFGRALEFRGSATPVIAEQWTKGDRVYALCTYPETPLIVARKFLDERVEDWTRSSEARAAQLSNPRQSAQQDLFSSQALIGTLSQEGPQRYLDDSTRREAKLEVIIPGTTETGQKSPVQVPRVLEREYRRMPASLLG